MDKLIKNIINYLGYLTRDCELNVSVHFARETIESISHSIMLHFLPYNCHTNPYCVHTKGNTYTQCILNQEFILKSCHTDTPFINICHAGVMEYIFPIFVNSSPSGFVSVSGYREDNSHNTNISDNGLWINMLKTGLPYYECNVLIPPLCIMLEKLLSSCVAETKNEYVRLLQFLNEYHTNITLSDLAKNFNRSNSHISHLFKNHSGISLRAYCNNLKLDDAKKLIITTDLSITDIAFDVGFNDVSYFIYLFKRKFGKTPLNFRNTKK